RPSIGIEKVKMVRESGSRGVAKNAGERRDSNPACQENRRLGGVIVQSERTHWPFHLYLQIKRGHAQNAFKGGVSHSCGNQQVFIFRGTGNGKRPDIAFGVSLGRVDQSDIEILSCLELETGGPFKVKTQVPSARGSFSFSRLVNVV